MRHKPLWSVVIVDISCALLREDVDENDETYVELLAEMGWRSGGVMNLRKTSVWSKIRRCRGNTICDNLLNTYMNTHTSNIECCFF